MLVKSCDRFADKLWAPLAPPEWRPAGNVKIPEASRDAQKRYVARPPQPVRIYATTLFVQSTLIVKCSTYVSKWPPEKMRTGAPFVIGIIGQDNGLSGLT